MRLYKGCTVLLSYVALGPLRYIIYNPGAVCSQVMEEEEEEERFQAVVFRWDALPRDLVQHVLACLPIPALLRASCVCKSWREIVFSAGFQKKYIQESRWLVTPASLPGRKIIFRAYSAAEHKWFTLPLTLSLSTATLKLVAAAPGLLCFMNNIQSYRLLDRITHYKLRLLVVNPVSKYTKWLPPVHDSMFSGCSFVKAAMKVVDNFAYTVLVLSDEHRGTGSPVVTIRDFHSAAGAWRIHTPVFPFPASMVLSTAVIGSRVYCVLSSSRRLRIGAYDMEQNVWTEVETPILRGVKGCQVVDCQDQLMLVGYWETQARKEARRIPVVKVYTLEMSSREWEEVGQKPTHICTSLGLPSCVGVSKGEMYFFGGTCGSQNLVRFDYLQQSWTVIILEHRNSGMPLVSLEPRWMESAETLSSFSSCQ